MRDRILFLTTVLLICTFAASVHAVTFRMYWDAARSTCTLDGIAAGQQLEAFLFAEGAGTIAGAALSIWQRAGNWDAGGYQFLQVHWPDDAYVYGEFGEGGANDRGVAMTFPCQPMPKLIARIDVLITSQPACLTFTKTATVGPPGSAQHNNPIALDCHLTINPDGSVSGGGATGPPLLVVNPGGHSPCLPCSIPVAAQSSTWGGIKAQYE